jgi:hypothetical protein
LSNSGYGIISTNQRRKSNGREGQRRTVLHPPLGDTPRRNRLAVNIVESPSNHLRRNLHIKKRCRSRIRRVLQSDPHFTLGTGFCLSAATRRDTRWNLRCAVRGGAPDGWNDSTSGWGTSLGWYVTRPCLDNTRRDRYVPRLATSHVVGKSTVTKFCGHGIIFFMSD